MRSLLTILCVLAATVLISPPRAFSQVEIFGGYSHLQLNTDAPNLGSGANGWEASAYLHLLGPFGAEADYSNHYGVSPAVSPTGGNHFVPGFTELYGPRFTISLPRIHPFVHALFGTVHGVAEVPSPILPPCPVSGCPTTTLREDAFGMALGGGINVKATRHIWLRLIQADYLRANFTNNAQNDARISTGIIFRFGEW